MNLDDHPAYAPIGTAPRDGTPIIVADMEMPSVLLSKPPVLSAEDDAILAGLQL